MTVDQMIEGWLNEVDADTTRTAYRRDFEAFQRWLAAAHPEVAVPDVTRQIAGEYAAHIRSIVGVSGRPLAESTRARRLAAVSSFYDHALGAAAVAANPLHRMKRPKVSQDGRTPARDESEVYRMRYAVTGRDRVVVGLLSVSGLRVTELCRADVKDLGVDKGVPVLAVRIKGGTRRNVTVPPGVLADLHAYLDGRTSGALVEGDDGKRLDRDRVATILRRAARAAGVADPELVRPHVMRASAITNLLERGWPIQDVQAMVGHRKPDTTARYWRRRAGILRDAELAAELESYEPPVEGETA